MNHFAHFSINEILTVGESSQTTSKTKPKGLYFNPYESWRNYCIENNIDFPYKYKYKIDLSNTKLTVLSINYNTINNIYENFSLQDGDYRILNWNEISKRFNGIYIHPDIIKDAIEYDKKIEASINRYSQPHWIWTNFEPLETIIIWSGKLTLLETNFNLLE